MMNDLNDFIFSSKSTFTEKAIKVFHFQYQHNQVYKRFADNLNCDPSLIQTLEHIPFLPISLFKNHTIISADIIPELIFTSSGTSNVGNSQHFVKEPAIYEAAFTKAFSQFYGSIQDYCIVALLPSYLERQGSSLVYMIEKMMEISSHPLNGFHLYDHQELSHKLITLEKQCQKTLLIGVTYALIEFAQEYSMPLKHTIVMETGGMKGKKKELVRSEVHQILKEAFNIKYIHSEYGMTELLSQAYAPHDGIFYTPAWMKILIREEDDPLKLNSAVVKDTVGAINVIDLANIFSCSFIATDDIGRLHAGGGFEVLGRMDNSDIRGCSLMAL